MIAEKKENYILIKPDKKNSDFFNNFKKYYHKFKHENIILDFSDAEGIKNEEIFLFSPIIEDHNNNGKSFVIVLDRSNLNDLAEDIFAVPTLKEAEDVVDFEDIERDLGI
jgi:hypothetical protein